MTLDRYVVRLLLVRTVAAVIVLIMLVQVLELLDVTSQILDRGLGLAGIGKYSLLRLPGMFQQTAGLAVLVGSIFTFTHLARTSEMIVIRATGANIYRVLRMMAPVAIAVAALDFVVAAEITPADPGRADPLDGRHRAGRQADPAQAALVPAGPDLVLVDVASDDGSRLQGVHIYRRDADRNLTQEVSAPLATPEAGGWRLHAAVTTRVGRTAPRCRRRPTSTGAQPCRQGTWCGCSAPAT